MQERELSINDYAEMVLKRKWIALAIFCISFIVCVIYTNMQPSIYKATLTFTVKSIFMSDVSEGTRAVYGKDSTTSIAPSAEELTDYAWRITSAPVIEAMLEEMKVITKDSSFEARDEEVKNIRRMLAAKVLPNSNTVSLTVTSRDRVLTATVANNLFDVFKKVNFEEKNTRKHNVTLFIQNALEDQLQKIREEEAQLRELSAAGEVGAVDIMRKQVDDLVAKRLDLLTAFTEDHPDVVMLAEQIDDLKSQIRNLPVEDFGYNELKRSIELDRALADQLKQKLQEAQVKEADVIDSVVLAERAPIPQSPFSPNKQVNYMLGIVLGAVLGIGAVIFVEQVNETSIGRVEEMEELLKVKVVGIIPFLSRANKVQTHKRKFLALFTKQQLEPDADYKNQLVAIRASDMVFEEAFRMLGTSIQTMFGENGRMKNLSIMITSSTPKEGKTLISANTAIIMAQMGYKTILIDSDLRRPSVHKIFGFAETGKGLADLLTGNSMLEDLESTLVKTATDLMLASTSAESIIDRPWLNNLHVLTAGAANANIIHLCNSGRLKEVFSYIKQQYDIVILDSAPILSVSDPSLLVPLVEGVLLVYRVGSTSRITLRRAKSAVESSKIKGVVDGLILNNVVPELMVSKSYYYS